MKPQLSSKAAQEIQVDPPDNKEKWRREGDFKFEIIFILQMQTNLNHIYNHKRKDTAVWQHPYLVTLKR